MSKPTLSAIKSAEPLPKKNGYTIIRASDVKIRPKQWVWEGHLLRGALELTTGIPGLGKSQAQIHMVACVTAGLMWPDGAKGMQPANVVMLTAEDTLDQEVVPRLIAAGADLARVRILQVIRKDGQDRQFWLGEDLVTLAEVVKEVGNVALITVDPITAYMGAKIDSHKSTEVRSQLGPLKDFAERSNVAISAITHPPKSASQRAIDHFIGSQAFIAACRIGHVCIEEVKDDEDKSPTGRVLFANAKNNAHPRMPTLAYRVEAIAVGQDEAGTVITAPRVLFDKAPVNITADEAVGRANGGGTKAKKRGAQADVQDFLESELSSGEWVPYQDIWAKAEKLGFSYEQLRTARLRLKVETKQMRGGWHWQWPQETFI